MESDSWINFITTTIPTRSPFSFTNPKTVCGISPEINKASRENIPRTWKFVLIYYQSIKFSNNNKKV
jgi:hypothetical protein